MDADEPRFYFAYGSNMDLVQMAQRCPGAAVLRNVTLDEFRVLINSRGVATVVKTCGARVHGLLWRISAANERVLDEYEGVAKGRYTKETVEVVDADGARYSALIYVDPNAAPGAPRAGYLELLIASAERCSFPTAYVEHLRSLRPR